jgi:subtilisin
MSRKMRMVQTILLVFFTLFIINGMVSGIAFAEDRNVIIGFKQSDDQTKEKVVHDNGGKVKKTFHIISAVSASISDANISKLKQDPRVTYVENDSIYKMSDEYTNTWGVQSIGSKPVHDNGIIGAGIKIAVLDTGIDYNHEDLKNNYKGGYNFVANNNDPWDDNCESYLKTCHGTHVAGTIAAELNGIGVVGVAPGASIYAVKVLDTAGGGYTSLVVSGIEWAVTNNMDIISMSLECSPSVYDPCDSIALQNIIDVAYNSGILLVASAGNTGGAVTYPAIYDDVIAVSAIDNNDQIASFSARGPKIELAAPGVNVNSTICIGPGYTCTTSSYGTLSGTSMAAPHVTGVAALIMSNGFGDANLDGEVNNKDVREILAQTARDAGTTGRDNIYGFGIVNASNAIFGIPAPTILPSIINFSPDSQMPVDDAGASRIFNITIDHIVNVDWYFDNIPFQHDDNVIFSQYTNTSASPGIWNITAIASNDNGSATKSWTWEVTSHTPKPTPTPKPTHTPKPTPTPKPTHTPKPTPTPKPTHTPKPTPTPKQ